METFSGQSGDESQHVQETRGLTWDQGGHTGQTLPRAPAVKARNKEVTLQQQEREMN